MSEKTVTIGDRETVVVCRRNGDDWEVASKDRKDFLRVISVRGYDAVVEINGQRTSVAFVSHGDFVQFTFRGETYRAEVGALGRSRSRHRDHSMAAPMPGVVLQILVQEDEEVLKGDSLIILEAMKMEHRITAPWDGVVESINCQEGEMVQPAVDLIRVKPKEAP